MKAYSIFDDFTDEAINILKDAGVEITVHPMGVSRPNDAEMKSILETYDCVIIGTSQKIKEEMFENISAPRIIATASVGLDHIKIPEAKKNLVTIYNTPKANAQSVAEYTIACALSCTKRLAEGVELYKKGINNKKLSNKPEDLCGKKIGVIGAGNISKMIMNYACMLGMEAFYWTAHPDKHQDITFQYVELDQLLKESDVISVNLPNNAGTKNLISKERVSWMKADCVFISVSRLDTIDIEALIERAAKESNFYINVDIDVDDDIVALVQEKKNVFVTPHIAGGTFETRKRMFKEVALQIGKEKRCPL